VVHVTVVPEVVQVPKHYTTLVCPVLVHLSLQECVGALLPES